MDQIRNINYRKIAFETYEPICVYCGFGIPSVLEVANIDGDRLNNNINSLVILCPNCHKMFDLCRYANDDARQAENCKMVKKNEGRR